MALPALHAFPPNSGAAARLVQALGLGVPGWIGVDLGCRAIKLAQLERRQGQLRLAKRWTLSIDAAPRLTREALEGGILAQRKSEFSSVRKLFAGADCAAVLSMSLVEMRSLTLPAAPQEEIRNMVREELAAESESDAGKLVFDFWNTPSRDRESAQATALAIPAGIASRIGGDLLSAGYACQVLDGLPCVLARAAQLAEGESKRPTAVLDLGDGAWTLVVASQGHPQFTRVLRGEGLRAILHAMEESLQLPPDQCAHLLKRYGVAGAAGVCEPGAEVVRQFVAPPLGKLVEELERTLAYVAQQFPQLLPAHLWLVGGGAAIPHLSTQLSQRVGIPARAWTLPGAREELAIQDAEFAAAAALSALKWEARPCI